MKAYQWVRICEYLGGGIFIDDDRAEWGYITNMFPDEHFMADNIDRNWGLIALSPEWREFLNKHAIRSRIVCLDA